MSEAELGRLRSKANNLRKEIAKFSRTVATERKKAADAQMSAGKSKSDSTVKMKLRQSDSATKKANDAEGKRADKERRLAETEMSIVRVQERLERNRAKALADLEKPTRQASAQFRSPPPAISSRSNPERRVTKDVFLSHASEDKDDFARPLKDALESRGISVWFDEIQIKVGQSIRQEIEKGITNCRFGIVVISPAFFAKQWTQAELDALFSKKMDSGDGLILPIWHKVTKDEVQKESPLLAGIHALNSSAQTRDQIADALAAVVRAGTSE